MSIQLSGCHDSGEIYQLGGRVVFFLADSNFSIDIGPGENAVELPLLAVNAATRPNALCCAEDLNKPVRPTFIHEKVKITECETFMPIPVAVSPFASVSVTLEGGASLLP